MPASVPGSINFPVFLDTPVSLIEATNNASTTLTAGINAAALIIPIADPGEFSSSGIATLTDSLTAPTKLELVIYTSKSGSNLIVPSGGRGAFGTTAQAWLSGEFVELRPLAQHHTTNASAIIAVETALQSALISVVWASPGAESGNAIEIAASCVGFAGEPFLSGLVDVKIIVSDGAADASPSHTATINAATVPVGTITEGAGTATATVRTDSSGNFKISISETAAASRYLWISTGGHSRLWVRSSTGVQQLVFT